MKKCIEPVLLMSNTVLFIFEGIKPETSIYNVVKGYFLQDSRDNASVIFYEADIYYFGEQILSDPDLDFFELLKEHNPNPVINDINRDEISQIFLFFDYDRHATLASDVTLEKMLNIFNNETESGKLYISYPMVEAIKDYSPDNLSDCSMCKVELELSCQYKAIVGEKKSIQHINKITYNLFKEIVQYNIVKANCLINDVCTKPSYQEFFKLNQINIHRFQVEKLIEQQEMIMILSAFPFFILEYFDQSYYNKI